MSIAIKRENGDLIWFDAVITYSRSYSSSISKHPIESGKTVTDNVTQENPQFGITGVITNADFNKDRPEITSSDAKGFDLSTRRIYNSQPIPDDARPIIGGGVNPLSRLIPQFASQFLEGQPPSVEVPNSQRPDWVFEVEDILIDIERKHELVDVLEFDKNIIEKVYFQCYISNVSFNETPETGDSFEVSLSIDQPRFVNLREAVLSEDVQPSLQTTTAQEENRGSQSPEAAGEEEELPNKDEETEIGELSSALFINNRGGSDLSRR